MRIGFGLNHESLYIYICDTYFMHWHKLHEKYPWYIGMKCVANVQGLIFNNKITKKNDKMFFNWHSLCYCEAVWIFDKWLLTVASQDAFECIKMLSIFEPWYLKYSDRNGFVYKAKVHDDKISPTKTTLYIFHIHRHIQQIIP